MSNPAKILLVQDLKVGMEDSFEEVISIEKIKEFSRISGDLNPLHNDPDFAKELGKPNIVAHGAIQQYLISRLAGMYLPGKYCILKKIDTNYLLPIYPEQKVIVQGIIKQWSAKNIDGELEIRIKSPDNLTIFSITRVRFGLTEISQNSTLPTNPQDKENFHKSEERKPNSGNKKKILLIGGSGGIGREINSYFTEGNNFEILSSGRNLELPNFRYDILNDPDDNGEKLATFCEINKIYAVIFLASGPPLKQSLTEINLDDLCENIKLHFKPLRDLAFNIKAGKNLFVKRLIVIGSSGSRDHFFEYGYESYSYAKLLAKLYVQDLSRELARIENLTLNIISPSEIAAGMNANMSERAKQVTGAKLPTGILTTPKDIYTTLLLLLDEKSSMIRGQELILSGGKVK